MSLPRKKETDEGIISNILKACFCVIEENITRLTNDSLSKGTCPEGRKTFTIILIPKIEKPKKASKYRPVNILPIYEKVLELVVKEQIEKYLQDNNIITEHQSDFRKNHSCETAIQIVFDDWKMLVSEQDIVGVIFLDFKLVFKTVDKDRYY